jgi:hypothetical protein
MARHFHRARWRVAVVALAAAVVVGVPSATAFEGGKVPKALLEHVSQAASLSYYLAHPDQAPSRLDALVDASQKQPPGRHVSSCGAEANKDVFNCDDFFGLPQNETSVGSCPSNDDFVLGGTNDYRGIFDPEGNFTGWHWSIDGGHSVRNEGLLPPVTLIRTPTREVPSGGDPVDFIPAGCDSVYAASLAYNPANPFGDANGIGVYKSTPEILSSCEPFVESPVGSGNFISNPACWPVRRLVAEADDSHFLDKEWMFVGVQNGVRYVWVTYSDFAIDNNAPLGYTAVSIKAVRCDENLVVCSEPIPISTQDQDVQFSDVTVGPDGRAYITWARIDGELEQTDQVFTIKYRSETAPGSMVFGPEKVVQVVPRAIPFGGFLQANDFRVATYPKSDVTIVNGHPRVFVIYDECTVRIFGNICERPAIKVTYSDDDGTTWSAPIVVSNGGVNYFPTISADRTYTTDNVAVGWYTNQYDFQFENQQDVVAASLNPLTGDARGLKRLTTSSNETEADPVLGGVFIGDYLEGVLIKNRYYMHYNANYRKVPLIGGFFDDPGTQTPIPVNQQDNYLAITGLN